MLYLNENEIINYFLEYFEKKALELYDLKVRIKKLKIEKSVATELYKEYKDGKNSSEVSVSFLLDGWKSYNSDGLNELLQRIIEEEEEFSPIVNLEVYEMNSKGKTSVNLMFFFVYVKYEIETDKKIDKDLKSGEINKADIIREIEMRLSEIYALLTKLK